MTLIPTQQLAADWRIAKRESPRFRWGLPWLERVLPAPWPGSLTVVGGATNTGKTFFLLGLLRAMAAHAPAAYISLEDAPLEVGRRCSLGLSHPNLFSMFPDETDLSLVIAAIEEAVGAGCKYVAIDYLQKIGYDSAIQAWGERDAIGKSVGRIQSTARRLGIPVILGSQLRRPSNDEVGRFPVPQQLKGAGEIENDSDFVILLGGKPKSEFVTAEVAKAKAAPVGDRMRFRRGPGGVLVPEPKEEESDVVGF